MKIAYHSDAFAGRTGYGLARYSRELWRAIQEQDRGVILCPFALRGAPHDDAGDGHKRWNGAVRPGMDGRLCIALWAVLRAPCIEHWVGDADLVHSVELDYPVATRRPWIVTVHDLGPLTHPQYFAKARPWLTQRALRQAVDRAAFIVAVSAATAASVEAIAGMSLGDRLQVVPEGVGDEFFELQDRACLAGLEDLPPDGVPYFLWTGSLNPRKNLATVVRAFEAVAAEIPHHLILAGGLGWDSRAALDRIAGSKCRERIHRPGFLTDGQLRALYQRASGFVYVSLMEGFGLPILEAMASGCPVITSNVSSMPEVAGDAALLVDPRNCTELGDAMRRIATDDALRAQLEARGRDRAPRYRWQHCASRMIELYRSAA
ncbi:MAG TPA: glycosyltransferase family 1 protein [Steroidobacteraceae bacterium]|nr:glycosyltransferase family 1 protein [Steroidobacteraceae bacterium]